ncbi:MAG: lysophospholipase, partial [Verrucomicrobia bacterium]|nr:lysophospholipase [Verrucomicrobiota bacterium]
VYQPFSDAHFKAFKDGIRWMHDTVVQYGARIVHVTPPPFDPVGSKKHLTARGLRGFYAPYTNYDDVLARYSAWLVSQRARGWDVVDIHTPMDQFLAQRRKTNPRFTFTRDGVHPDVQGHWLMAREILMHWDAPDSLAKMDSVNAMVADDPRGAELLKAVVEKQDILRGAWLTYVGHMNFRFKPGLPLAQAEQRAAALDKKIRALEARQL